MTDQQQNGAAPTVDTRLGSVQNVATLLEGGLPQLAQALPSHVDAERFVKVVLTVVHQTPKLLLCTRGSFFLAALQCAELGLEPHLGQAYIIPYRNKRDGQWVHEATFQTGYRGLQILAMRSGRYERLEARVVREGDEFHYQFGLNPDLTHVPALTVEKQPLTHVYSIAWPKDVDQRPGFEPMSREQVEAIRQKSKAKDDGPWVTDFDEMARKTVFNRHAKWLDLSPEVREVIERDQLADTGGLLTTAASVLLRKASSMKEIVGAAAEVDAEIKALPKPPTRTDEVREELEQRLNGTEDPPSLLDSWCQLPKFRGRPWRDVVDDPDGAKYINSFVLTKGCKHDSVTPELREVLTMALERKAANGEEEGTEESPEQPETPPEAAAGTLEEAYERAQTVAGQLVALDEITYQETTEIDLLRDDGNLQGLADLTSELETRLEGLGHGPDGEPEPDLFQEG